EKAAAAGDQVSKLLEIGRAQLDSSFGQLKSIIIIIIIINFHWLLYKFGLSNLGIIFCCCCFGDLYSSIQ
ncbi:MAG: hypothetical protein N7Q72_07535, partial [Spiroplasma sp. Tabriz.8]|nr:hypothetical protein [Spiroplasma sp. Tabriz.8]